ncbi:hypothetical protein CB1_000306002 [Camelus ferus]|nr:hypothetical protein CB1_000306002 [Camelus ferus]
MATGKGSGETEDKVDFLPCRESHLNPDEDKDLKGFPNPLPSLLLETVDDSEELWKRSHEGMGTRDEGFLGAEQPLEMPDSSSNVGSWGHCQERPRHLAPE